MPYNQDDDLVILSNLRYVEAGAEMIVKILNTYRTLTYFKQLHKYKRCISIKTIKYQNPSYV